MALLYLFFSKIANLIVLYLSVNNCSINNSLIIADKLVFILISGPFSITEERCDDG